MSKQNKSSVPRKFFINDKLYRREKINRTDDTILCWSPEEREFVYLSYTFVLNNWKRAYTIAEAAEMLGRSKNTLWNYIYDGKIVGAHKVYNARPPGTKTAGWFMSPDHVEVAWRYFFDQNIGRPRKDGKHNPGKNLPTLAELRARMEGANVLYYKDEETGEFRPTWRA